MLTLPEGQQMGDEAVKSQSEESILLYEFSQGELLLLQAHHDIIEAKTLLGHLPIASLGFKILDE